jgi:hypothetical protein
MLTVFHSKYNLLLNVGHKPFMLSIVLSIIVVSVVLLSVIVLSVVLLSVIVLSVVVLSVIMQSFIVLSVIMQSVVVLSVCMQSGVVLSVIMQSVMAPPGQLTASLIKKPGCTVAKLPHFRNFRLLIFFKAFLATF